MSQTKQQSFIESLTNTFFGFAISLVSTFFIFPLVGFQSNFSKNLIVTLFFTVISIVRGYLIRRYFNKAKDSMVRTPNGKLFWIHCFNCENDMPVKVDKKYAYCSNCGLKH